MTFYTGCQSTEEFSPPRLLTGCCMNLLHDETHLFLQSQHQFPPDFSITELSEHRDTDSIHPSLKREEDRLIQLLSACTPWFFIPVPVSKCTLAAPRVHKSRPQCVWPPGRLMHLIASSDRRLVSSVMFESCAFCLEGLTHTHSVICCLSVPPAVFLMGITPWPSSLSALRNSSNRRHHFLLWKKKMWRDLFWREKNRNDSSHRLLWKRVKQMWKILFTKRQI